MKMFLTIWKTKDKKKWLKNWEKVTSQLDIMKELMEVI